MTEIMITGIGSGIGQALAIQLAQAGHSIIGVGRRLEALQDTQKFRPEKISIVQADIAEPKDRQKIIDAIPELTSPLFLVHNAAITEPTGLLKDINVEEWRYLQKINVEAPLFLTQQLLPKLQGGRVLFMSSGLAHFALPGVGAYSISKAALFMLYKCFYTELKEFNIAVGSFSPGVIDTPMQSHLRSLSAEKLPVKDTFVKYKKNNELGMPEHVAEFLSWLLFKTTQEEFSQTEWDLDNPNHRAKWLEKA